MKVQHKNIVFEVEYDTTQGAYFRQSKKSLYVEQYLLFRQKIINNVGKFIRIEVKIKSPPKHYHTVVSKKGSNLQHDSKHARLVNYPRKNAFEATIDNFVLFSRLKQEGWPNVDKISEWALRVFMKITEQNESQQTEMNCKPHPTVKLCKCEVMDSWQLYWKERVPQFEEYKHDNLVLPRVQIGRRKQVISQMYAIRSLIVSPPLSNFIDIL